jgi:hypothetical protein
MEDDKHKILAPFKQKLSMDYVAPSHNPVVEHN